MKPLTLSSTIVALRGAAASALAAAAGAAVVMSWTTSARAQGPTAEAQVAALAKQVAALEQRLAAIEGQGTRVRAPFEVVDVQGRRLLRVESTAGGAGALMVGEVTAGGVRLGVGASGSGFLNIRRTDGAIGLSAGEYRGGPMGVQVFDKAGAGGDPIAELGAGANDKGALRVGAAASGGASIDVGASSAGVLRVRRPDGSVGTSIGQYRGRPMGLQVFDASAAGSDPIVDLGADDSGGGAITVTDAAKKPILRVGPGAAARDARVSIGAGDGRYAVTVSAESGTLLAAVGEARNGAGVAAVNDATGSMRAVMNGANGEIHVLDGGGQSRATMVTDNGQGAFSIRNAGGTTVLRIGEGAQGGGLFQLANAAGSAMVEAGILPAGTGVVRAYPLGSPGAGFVGMPGTFIMGRAGGR